MRNPMGTGFHVFDGRQISVHLLALQHFTVVTSLYQVVSIFMEIGVVIMLFRRRAVLAHEVWTGDSR